MNYSGLRVLILSAVRLKFVHRVSSMTQYSGNLASKSDIYQLFVITRMATTVLFNACKGSVVECPVFELAFEKVRKS